VGEGLGKIAELPFGARIVFLGQQAEVVPQFQQALEEFPRFRRSTRQMETIGEPERARQEHTF
jgi:hypothetical protein